MRTRLIVAVGLLLALYPLSEAESEPRKALTLDSGSVVKYGARMRVTKSAWDFALLTIRDNFKTWSAPNGAAGLGGANLLLDPGYDYVTHGAAGPVRTSPFLWDWARYDQVNRGTASCSGGGCVSSGCRTSITCGNQSCSRQTIIPEVDGRRHWTQVRRCGSSLTTNRPLIPGFYHTALRFREYGYYVADPGADFKQLQFCTYHTNGSAAFQFDLGSGKSGDCDGKKKVFEVSYLIDTTDVNLFYNVRLFIYPNNRTEYMGVGDPYTHDPAQAWDPWNPPTNRGNFAGVGGAAIYCGTVYNCGQANCWRRCSNCCYLFNSCDDWSSNCTTYNQDFYKYENSLASNAPNTSWNTRDGTYLRTGDDQALYTNVGQMQIHSINRNSFLGTESVGNWRGCEIERWYLGTWGAVPNYGNTNQKIANCLYPKSYWDGAKWKACNPFDSWNADGTVNEYSDDHKFMYPGDPDTGLNNFGGNSPGRIDGIGPGGRCGRQPLCTIGTGGNCTVNTATDTWCKGEAGAPCNGAYARTTRFKDMLKPGGGWYLIEITQLDMIAGSATPTSDPLTQPRMKLSLRIPEVRAELGAAITLRTEGALVVDRTYDNVKAAGQIRFDSIVIDATIRIFSIDDKSCVAGTTATCTTPWLAWNDNAKIRPDKVHFDISIDKFTINPPAGAWYKGSCDTVTAVLMRLPLVGDVITANISSCGILNDDLWIWGIHIGSVGLKDMLKGIIEDALADQVKSALGDFVAAVPNLNSVLGDPIDAGTSLVETGVYMTGGMNERIIMPDGTARWPISMQPWSQEDREVTDFRLSLGFKPIAFTDSGLYNVYDAYTGDAPSNSAFYGVPELWNPDTSGCGANCSLGSHATSLDEDQQYDGDDYALTGSATYKNPKDPAQSVTVTQNYRIPEYWKGPIPESRRPPPWCSYGGGKGAPANILNGNGVPGGTDSDLAALYPQETWLSFDPAYDKAPSLSGRATPPQRNTFAGWDTMDPGTVFKQEENDGSKDPAAIPYDFSLHIHQRTIVQFLQALVSSGVTCIEFAAQDAMGADTPFKSFLSTDAFAAFLPGIQTLYPHAYMKIRIDSMGTPRVRTGMGALQYVPFEEGTNLQIPEGEFPIPLCKYDIDPEDGVRKCMGPLPYMLSAAFPDTRITFLVSDPEGVDIPVLTMYWTPVVGVHMQSVRKCYYLDPLLYDTRPGYREKCTSSLVNVRTVSGYNEIYVDINSPSLKQAWERGATNNKDFPTGYFDDIGSARFFSTAPDSEKKSIVIESSLCQSGRCDMHGFSQMIPTLMNSMISIFLVSRVSFKDLTLDLLYTGADGPNDDGVGASGVGGGDYIGIYARFLGSLDLFSLLSDLDGLLAPPSGIQPKAFVPEDTGAPVVVNTNSPTFPVTLIKQFSEDSDIAYSYSVDSGFWHTQTNQPELQLTGLLEGEHTLALRAVEHTKVGATASVVPEVFHFRVDTLPPKIEITPSESGVYRKAVKVNIEDLQTPSSDLVTEFSWDGGDDWEPLDGSTISLRGLKSGRHTLRVRSTDTAGNVGQAAREIVTEGKSGWGCSQGASSDGWLWMLMAILPLVRRRRT